ncbi:MAG: shikimate kinase, partial [Actinomycetales bacterium]|nr:shikimate kinase [Actinomycetales bacterium]
DGEEEFRRIEERIIGETLESFGGVLSLGGGAVLSAVTRERLRGLKVIHLTIGVAEGVRRSRGPGRPLLAGGDATARYQAILTERAPLYREVAWTTVSTERRSSGKVVSDIVDRLESGDPHLRSGAGRS